MFKIRKASPGDVDAITEIYNKVHTMEENGEVIIGWKREIYPTRKTAETSVAAGEMYVAEDESGRIVASGRFNQIQDPSYKKVDWEYKVPDEDVMVFHTLTVDPEVQNSGCGRTFFAFYEKIALEHGCHYLRIDTNELNLKARALYKKLGYKERGTIFCQFNGLDDVRLVCLEKKLDARDVA